MRWFELVIFVIKVIISGGKKLFSFFIMDIILFVEFVFLEKYEGINLNIKLLFIFV